MLAQDGKNDATKLGLWLLMIGMHERSMAGLVGLLCQLRGHEQEQSLGEENEKIIQMYK
jgi:hypothetical protein